MPRWKDISNDPGEVAIAAHVSPEDYKAIF